MNNEDLKLDNYLIASSYYFKLTTLLKHVVDVLDTHDIPYWIADGTLLGYQRFGSIMPWDDDCDLGILEEDKERAMMALMPLIWSVVHSIQECRGFFKLIDASLQPDITSFRVCGMVCIDLFYYKKIDGRYVLSGDWYREKYTNCFYEADDLFPLQTVQFDGFDVKIPNKPKAYLDRYYRHWDKFYVVQLRNKDDTGDLSLVYDAKTEKFIDFYNKKRHGDMDQYLDRLLNQLRLSNTDEIRQIDSHETVQPEN